MIKLKSGQIVLDENGDKIQIGNDDFLFEEKIFDTDNIKHLPYGKELIALISKIVSKSSPDKLKDLIYGAVKSAVDISPIKDKIKFIKDFFSY